MKDMDNIKTVKKEWVCKSGTDDQILNSTEQNCDYFVDNLFEEAQKVGAMCVPPTTVKNQVDVIIKLWKNGFTVNDSELRSYTDVANQQFLESIKKGELPFELRKVFDKEEIEVKVEDKKDKVYLSSKRPIFHPFSGHGYRLGRGNTRMKDMDNIKTVKKEWVCKSGTDDQILNSTEQNCDYFVDNLFEEAQKVGAMCVPPTTVKNQVDVIIKLWKNGFTVNDSELRSYTDVANQQFLESIKKGELPFELRKVFDKEEIEVKVEDKKDKVYLSSKRPIFHPFSGHGYRLGSATPKIISEVRDDHQGPDDKRHLPLVPLNDLEPITNVQIWLADGERIIQKFNVSHRISHVRDFITKYQGSEGSVPFTLTTSLPFRELQDETLTLEEAKLQNAVVVQRLRKTTEPFRLLVIKAPENDCKTAATPNGQLKNEQKTAINSTRSN